MERRSYSSVFPVSWEEVPVFLEHNAPTFDGHGTPEQVWGWIMETESLLVLLRVPIVDWAEFAIEQFREAAVIWWNAEGTQIFQGATLERRWSRLMRALIERHGLAEYVQQNVRRFRELRLGPRLIGDYVDEFYRRMHLARHLVSDARDEVRYFVRGLPEKYQSYVGATDKVTEAVVRAIEVYHNRVHPTAKWAEAERVRTRRMIEECTDSNICVRCEELLAGEEPCECVRRHCYVCGDWRHVARTCPNAMNGWIEE